MTIRELSAFLGVRLPTAYGLVWDGTVKAAKQDGEWIVDRESAEAYQVQRSARHARVFRSRAPIGHTVIDVAATTVVNA